MVRLWTWEAFAHGAEAVCYFRWRQAPFAQEQNHAGLLRPDSVAAPGLLEAAEVARELPSVSGGDCPADVALVFDYESAWAWSTQPQGADFDYFRLCFAWYRAARSLGLNIDIIPPDTTDLSRWKLVLAPGLFTLSPELRAALERFQGLSLLGPRTNSRTRDFAIPVPLGPSLPGLEARVIRVESLPPGAEIALSDGGRFVHWAEEVEGSATTVLTRADGLPALLRAGGVHYLTGWPDDPSLRTQVQTLCAQLGLVTHDLPDGLRTRVCGDVRFWFNHNATPLTWQGQVLDAAGVWMEPAQ
jgi:beta-galactosidase